VIVIDASAIVAMVKDEPGSARMGDLIAEGDPMMGAPSLLETRMVLSKVLSDEELDLLINSLVAGGLRVVDFTPAMAEVATVAFRTFGKGRGHPAQLNFGDCMAYAVAKVHGAPLLYKGKDFSQTDMRSALA
jgi:ribonuclease VapC